MKIETSLISFQRTTRWQSAALLMLGAFSVFISPAAIAAENNPPRVGEPSTLILGVAQVPEYSGADSTQSAPLIISRFRVADKPVQIAGTQARIGLHEQGKWWAGPQLNIVAPRDDSATDDRVASFEAIDLSVELGGFVGYRRPMGSFEEGLLESAIGISAPASGDWEGTSLTLETEYSWAATFMWRLALGASLTLADDDYANSRYGVSQTDSALSGLSEFVPEGGLQSATVSIRSLVSLSPRWGIFTRFAYTELLNDAADSPIVTEAGSSDQTFAGIGVFWLLSK